MIRLIVDNAREEAFRIEADEPVTIITGTTEDGQPLYIFAGRFQDLTMENAKATGPVITYNQKEPHRFPNDTVLEYEGKKMPPPKVLPPEQVPLTQPPTPPKISPTPTHEVTALESEISAELVEEPPTEYVEDLQNDNLEAPPPAPVLDKLEPKPIAPNPNPLSQMPMPRPKPIMPQPRRPQPPMQRPSGRNPQVPPSR